MKNIFKILLCTLVVLNYGCSDDDELPVDFDDLNVSGQPYAVEIGATGLIDINKIDIAPAILSGFTKTYQFNSLQNGTDVTKLEVYVGFNGENISANEALYLDVPSSNFVTDQGNPQYTINFVWSDVLSLLGLTLNDLEGGDLFTYRLALTNAAGTFSDISANFDNQSADHIVLSNVVCLIAPVAGDWDLSMTDLYGDGWNGGEITVNIDGVTSTYSAAGSGTDATINIPVGTAIFTFTYSGGSWEGENLYTLTDPNGLVVLDEGVGDFSFSNGPTEGELLNACP